jgi:hypothetical protein
MGASDVNQVMNPEIAVELTAKNQAQINFIQNGSITTEQKHLS